MSYYPDEKREKIERYFREQRKAQRTYDSDGLTVHGRLCLARLVARQISRTIGWKIDARSWDALKRRGFIRIERGYVSEDGVEVTPAGLDAVDADEVSTQLEAHMREARDEAREHELLMLRHRTIVRLCRTALDRMPGRLVGAKASSHGKELSFQGSDGCGLSGDLIK